LEDVHEVKKNLHKISGKIKLKNPNKFSLLLYIFTLKEDGKKRAANTPVLTHIHYMPIHTMCSIDFCAIGC